MTTKMTQKEMLGKIMEKLDSMDSRITVLEKNSKKSVAPNAKKNSSKKNSSSKPTTRKEAIDAWCEEKGYTAESRKAFGEAKKAERAIQKQAYEMTNSHFKTKVDYKVWRAEYEKNLKKLSK